MKEDWIGVVFNTTDPTFSGRAQIKVFGILDEVNEEHLPWATPVNSAVFAGNGAGSISVPKVGMFVRVRFNNGDLYAPEYTVIQNVDSELIQRIKNDYDGTHVLLYDPSEELTVIYQKQSGFQLYHKKSIIQITPDSMITLQTPDNESVIQLEGNVTRIATKNEVEISGAEKATVNAKNVVVNGSNSTEIGPGPMYSAVLGEPLWTLLTTMATTIDLKQPPSAPVLPMVKTAKLGALSGNVKISK